MPPYLRTLLLTGPADDVERALPEYAKHLQELRDRGKLRLAGEFARGDGYFELLEMADRREADASALEHPLIRPGLVSWMIRQWSEVELDT